MQMIMAWLVCVMAGVAEQPAGENVPITFPDVLVSVTVELERAERLLMVPVSINGGEPMLFMSERWLFPLANRPMIGGESRFPAS